MIKILSFFAFLFITLSAHAGIMKIYGPDGSESGAQFWSGYYGSVRLGVNLQPVGGSVYSTLNGSYVSSAGNAYFSGLYNQAQSSGGFWPPKPKHN